MKLSDVVSASPPSAYWEGNYKVPWNDPACSPRFLAEHLDQTHDAASRRLRIVDKHVAWIHRKVIGGSPARVLDLGCGPGLYSSRLALLGHQCLGIDFSPASIEHARQEAAELNVSCQYVEDDLRTADFGRGHDLAMLLFGEFNTFAPDEIQAILGRVHAALAPGGQLLLEPQRFDAVQRTGNEPSTWHRLERGLFSDHPHIYLEESFWDEDRHLTVERYFVIDAASAEVTEYRSTTQAYTQAELTALLVTAGFGDVSFHPSLTGSRKSPDPDLMVVRASRS